MPNPLMNAPHGPAVPESHGGYLRVWLALACALSAFASSAVAAPFDTLDGAQRADVADRCLPYRYERGGADTTSVRDCLERASNAAEPELSLDEQYALRQLCDGDEACETRERQALAAQDRGALDTLPVDERDVVRRHCRAAQDNEGPVAWTACLVQAVADLRQGPVLDRQALSFASRRAALSVCTDRAPAAYRRCLQETGMPVDTSRAVPTQVSTGPASEIGTPDEVAVTGDGLPDTGPDDTTATAPDLKTRLTDSFEALDDTGRLLLLAAALLPLLLWLTRRLTHRRDPEDDAHEIDGHDYGTLAERVGYDRDAQHDASDAFEFDFGDDPERGDATGSGPGDAYPGQVPDAGSALWDTPPEHGLPDQLRTKAADPFAERSRFEGEADRLFEHLDEPTPTGAEAAKQRTEPVEATDPLAPGAVEVSRHDDYETMSDDLVATPLGALPDDDIEAAIAGSAVTVPAPFPVVDPPAGQRVESLPREPFEERFEEPFEDQAPFQDAEPTPVEPELPLGAASPFGDWLIRQPDDVQLTHVIEFFVYWMAYGDKRYDDAMRRTLLAHDEGVTLSEEQAIKRWVLLEDAEAFVDAVQWMISNASAEQCRQAVRLLIALLVPDATPTPVQNTLLRFLADAFGLQARGLATLWQEGFDALLPGLPRVDRADWWATQNEDALAERDARQVATYPAQARHAARLGLPLDGPYEAARIRAASRLAIQRTEPEGFEALGERAMTLAARQLERIEQARDALLEEALP